MTTASDSPHPSLPRDIAMYEELLSEHFGFPQLRPHQQQVLEGLADNDVLAVMPTGGGKSLCYVLPALEAGRVLVVSPLIALMHDQVEALSAAGVPAGAINSSLSRDEQNRRYLNFINGRLKLLYVAPERLANDRFVSGLRRCGITLLAIDEAHCVSEWGHDFRPDYLMLGHVRERLGAPRTLALTATAEPTVRNDIASRLGIAGQAQVIVASVDRPNLTFRVVPVSNDQERKEWLTGYLRTRPEETGIVYARTRRGVDDLAEDLRAADIDAEAYHAGLPAEERTAIQRRFTTDRRRVIVATNAFGLGIDKPDVRFVVHANMPGRLESYYQEAGRAGRDGEPAECTLLYDPKDARAQQYFIDQAHPDDRQARDVWQRILESNGEAFIARHGERAANEDGLPMALAALRAADLIDVYGKPTLDGPLPVSVGNYIQRHRRYAEDRLARMVEYAQAERCRRSIILRYFGETPEEACGMCDICLAGRSPGANALLDQLSALRDRLARRYRRDADDLMDTRTLRELATYRPRTKDELLETWGIGQVKARWFGDDLLGAIHEWEAAHPDAPEREVRRRPKRRVLPREEIHTLPVDDELYQRLTWWRRDRAERDGVPAYIICGNKTLLDIAARRPKDRRALESVWGLGESRIEHYGHEILALVNPEHLLHPKDKEPNQG